MENRTLGQQGRNNERSDNTNDRSNTRGTYGDQGRDQQDPFGGNNEGRLTRGRYRQEAGSSYTSDQRSSNSFGQDSGNRGSQQDRESSYTSDNNSYGDRGNSGSTYGQESPAQAASVWWLSG